MWDPRFLKQTHPALVVYIYILLLPYYIMYLFIYFVIYLFILFVYLYLLIHFCLLINYLICLFICLFIIVIMIIYCSCASYIMHHRPCWDPTPALSVSWSRLRCPDFQLLVSQQRSLRKMPLSHLATHNLRRHRRSWLMHFAN